MIRFWERFSLITIMICLAAVMTGCGSKNDADPVGKTMQDQAGNDDVTAEDPKEGSDGISVADGSEADTEDDSAVNTMPEPTPGILIFHDVHGMEYEMVIQPGVPECEYDKELFVRRGNKIKYKDDSYEIIHGIDVSYHQGNIDWEKVRSQGYEFAFIRIGYRGYSKGSLSQDSMFEANIKGAKAAGLQVGVYFFAQAINEEEALEEAEFVLKLLNGRKLDLPVVYDPETITDDAARTDNVSGVQFTKNTGVFCDRIKEAGYEPMIYANMLWEAYELDLTELTDIPIWYADYDDKPQTPYHFSCWQYSQDGNVKGINGTVDLDVIIKKTQS